MKPQGWLLPLSILMQAVVQLRNRFYDRGILTTDKAAVPVISIGNISTGGTGKTPFVIHIIERLNRLMGTRRVKTAVITRGYGGSAIGTHVVSDGKRVKSVSGFAGDEPILIAESLPGSAVIKDKKRKRGADYAVDELKSRLLVLDDGFQHRKLHRDLDIVLLDASDPLGNRRVLPAGFLREPVSSLKRADIVVLSKADGKDEKLLQRAARLSELIKKPVIVSRVLPKFWRRCNQSELLTAEQIKGKKVVAFAGIAKPRSFFETVASLGAEIVDEIALPDHCKYDKKHLDLIGIKYVQARAEWLVTTFKDAVKLPGILNLLPVYYLEIGMETIAGSELLDEKLGELIKKSRSVKLRGESRT